VHVPFCCGLSASFVLGEKGGGGGRREGKEMGNSNVNSLDVEVLPLFIGEKGKGERGKPCHCGHGLCF